MRRKLTALLVLTILLSACTQKPNTDPSTLARFNSLSARLDRIATIYTTAALKAIPYLAPIRKWTDEQVKSAERVIGSIRDSAAAGRRTLGAIVDSAITSDQKVIIGPLLEAIGNGLTELDNLGLFDGLEGSKIETGLRVAALALKQIGRLLPRQVT